MSVPPLQARIDAAMDLAERAGEMAMSMRPPPGSPRGTMKGPQDWVTEADGAVELFLSQELSAAFPSDGFQGEEGGMSRGGAPRRGGGSDRRSRQFRSWCRSVLRLVGLPGG